MSRLSTLTHSLGFRLLVPILLTTGIVMTVHAVMTFHSIKDHFLRFAETDVERQIEMIKRATHDGMLLNRKADVQLMIERLAAGPDIACIRVYDKQGVITMSGDKAEIGRHMGIDSETCLSCHKAKPAHDTATLEQRGMTQADDGGEVLRHMSVIENQNSCATAACHAHPETNRVLGVLDLEMSMRPANAAGAAARRQVYSTTSILVVVVGIVVAIVIRRFVQRPIAQLYKGIRRIADGDMATQVEIPGQHELSRLAGAFNDMAKDLGAARQEITEWSQKLEDKVLEKTSELSRAQRQVLHMEKMASLGKLSATVAHELNNPLSGMLTFARLVRRDIEKQPIAAETREELSRYLRLVEKECSRCGSIVQNLLVFTRRMNAETTIVDVNEIVEQSIMLIQHHLQLSNIELSLELLPGDSSLLADGAQVQQALVALLVNAVESMQDEGREDRRLSVRLEGNADEVQIHIGDTGVGIPPEVLQHIFEPFFSTKQAESGVGLGLSVVYGIVERHEGRIEVDSQVGQGTTFHIHLPRKSNVKAASGPVAAESPTPSHESPS